MPKMKARRQKKIGGVVGATRSQGRDASGSPMGLGRPALQNLRQKSSHLQRLVLVLELIQLVIDSTPRQQFLMAPHFAHLPFVHDEDLVCILNR